MPPAPIRRTPAGRAVRAVGLVVCPLVAAACGGGGDPPAGLSCTPLVAPADAPDPVTVDDTLRTIVALDRRTRPVEVLVRVDRIEDEGLIAFPDVAPATAVGAGASVVAPALYQMCVSSAPRVVVFQGTATPHDKVWIRVTTDRPVEVAVRIGGDGGVTLSPSLHVAPGGSARHRWTIPEASR